MGRSAARALLGWAVGLLAAPVVLAQSAPPAPPAWVAASNAHTMTVLQTLGVFSPEFVSQLGLAQFDGLASDLGPRLTERRIAAMERSIQDLRQRLAAEADADVRQDLQILIDAVQLQLDGARLSAELELDWIDVPQAMFQGLSGLLAEQVAPQRRAKALALLQRYVGQHPGSEPLTRLARDRFDDSRKPGRIGPVKAEVEQALQSMPTYAKGIRDLFTRFGIEGAEPSLAALDAQFAEHADWVRRTVLPLAREDFRRPPALYAHALRSMGLDLAPTDLIQRAQASFHETRTAMAALAPQVVRALQLPALDPGGGPMAVLQALKRQTIPDDQLVAHYTDINTRLEAVIRRERIVTLPERSMVMRLATPAETAATPAPHMKMPPLIGNTGQRGQFVLPARNPAAGPQAAFDDFNFPAVAWTLSAHEGRPGHELQFSAMVERGVSLARSLFAFNSVNVEGWALYAEAEMLPHEPLEGQFIALQFRLLRAARAMLDPMLNLGQITPEAAARVLRDEVGLSPAMVRQEIDRYTFRVPGQAGTYFYGYQRLLQLRTETELALGPRFDRLAFHDFLLAQGLLPPDLLARAVRERFIPQRRTPP